MRGISMLVIFFALLPAYGRAQTHSTLVCDIAFASISEKYRPVDAAKHIDIEQAWMSCEDAVIASHESPQSVTQLASIELAKGENDNARVFLEQAAEQGYPAAQYWLGYMHENGLGGLSKDDREAARLNASHRLAGRHPSRFKMVAISVLSCPEWRSSDTRATNAA